MTARVRNPLLATLAVALAIPLAACAREPSPVPAAAPAATAAPVVPAAPLVTGLPDFTALVERVGPGVVNIEARIGARTAARGMPGEEEIPEIFRRFFGPGFGMPSPGASSPARSVGSGFLIGDGYVLTNHHVVDGAEAITVRLSDRRELQATVVGSDEGYDVALLKLEGKDVAGLPALRLGDSSALRAGQWVVAIGSPLGLEQSVTAGIVSALGRSGGPGQQYVPFIQTDVAINRGNSGGPLLNTSGEVVGINSQILSNSGGYMGVSFAIPIALAMDAAEQIKKTGKVSRGMLGVTVQEIDAVRARALGLSSSAGALVNGVEPDSAAQKGGVEIGDVILAVNGQAINSSSDLPPLIGMLQPGSKTRLDILREGKKRELTVTLGALTGEAQRPAARGPAATAASPATRIGLQVADLDAATRRQLGLGNNEGVRITAVESAEAREARLRPGMVILQVGRTRVGTVAALERELGSVDKGDAVMLLVRDASGANSFVALTVGEG